MPKAGLGVPRPSRAVSGNGMVGARRRGMFLGPRPSHVLIVAGVVVMVLAMSCDGSVATPCYGCDEVEPVVPLRFR